MGPDLLVCWSGRRDSNPRPSPWQREWNRPARPETIPILAVLSGFRPANPAPSSHTVYRYTITRHWHHGPKTPPVRGAVPPAASPERENAPGMIDLQLTPQARTRTEPSGQPRKAPVNATSGLPSSTPATLSSPLAASSGSVTHSWMEASAGQRDEPPCASRHGPPGLDSGHEHRRRLPSCSASPGRGGPPGPNR